MSSNNPSEGLCQRSRDDHAVLRTREFWLFTSYLSGTFTVNSAFQVHMIPYFQQDIGLTATWAAVVMSVVFIISGIGRIGGGYLLDRMDYLH